MSELFGKNSKHLMKKNVMKDEFGWEIPYESVPLPSKGTVYSPDSILYKKDTIKIKSMTAREEDILTSPALLKEGTVMTHLLKSCIVEGGFDVDDLIIGDRNAILTSIRITGYGTGYTVIPKCSSCGHANELTVDLSALKIKRLKIEPVEAGKNLFEFVLPVTNKKILFRYTTASQENERIVRSENIKKHLNTIVDDTVSSSVEFAIHSIDDISDRNKIKHFVLNMPAFDSRALRKYMRENEPGIDMTHSFTCSACSYENNFIIPVTANFFWPEI